MTQKNGWDEHDEYLDDFFKAIDASSEEGEQKAVEAKIDDISKESSSIHSKLSDSSRDIATSIYIDWSVKEKEEITQRKKLTTFISGFLVVQWAAAVVLIILQGIGLLAISETIFISFFAAVIVQTIAIVLAMVAYLYKERSSTPLDIISKLLSSASSSNVNYKNESNTK